MDYQFSVVLAAIKAQSCASDVQEVEDLIWGNYKNLMIFHEDANKRPQDLGEINYSRSIFINNFPNKVFATKLHSLIAKLLGKDK